MGHFWMAGVGCSVQPQGQTPCGPALQKAHNGLDRTPGGSAPRRALLLGGPCPRTLGCHTLALPLRRAAVQGGQVLGFEARAAVGWPASQAARVPTGCSPDGPWAQPRSEGWRGAVVLERLLNPSLPGMRHGPPTSSRQWRVPGKGWTGRKPAVPETWLWPRTLTGCGGDNGGAQRAVLAPPGGGGV